MLTKKDVLVIWRALGRKPRGIIDVPVRCVCKNPIVVRCKPLLYDDLDDNSGHNLDDNLNNKIGQPKPFPTFYYLVSSDYIKAISTLEAKKVMKTLNEKLVSNSDFKEQYFLAHQDYIKDREKFEKVSQISDMSAGGAPRYIKCLHSHLAHSLAQRQKKKKLLNKNLLTKGLNSKGLNSKNLNPVGEYLLENYDFFNINICRCAVPYNKAPRRRAIIDCGTNTIRLAIMDVFSKKYLKDIIPRKMIVNRLGKNLEQSQILDEESLNKTFFACREYKKLIDKNLAQDVIFIATSAARDAKNSDELLKGVEKILQIKPQILSGDDEAKYSYLGVISSNVQKSNSSSLVIDIGGGSTEIAFGTKNNLKSSYSMQAGSIRLAELFFHNLPPANHQMAKAKDFLEGELKLAISKIFSDSQNLLNQNLLGQNLPRQNSLKTLLPKKKINIYGVAGTITTITANALGLSRYDWKKIDKTSLTLEEIIISCDQLIAMNYKQLEALPFMHKGRIDSMAAGAVIYKEVLSRLEKELTKRNFQINKIITSEKDLLDGLALFF
ncbi:MAG: DUF501 domain-containing protein [Bifidobacteriaceae bacterium]|jgi:exopolyphosphatase/guanosine-5'-triphosphate,3'-diphosphate pyrophosphatase|nr:DUF501 domain-containing protein [Bifidobacteriaceae bacterium]